MFFMLDKTCYKDVTFSSGNIFHFFDNENNNYLRPLFEKIVNS